MPDELASEAGRPGNAARAASKRSICARLMGSPGISDETKWLISKSAPLDGAMGLHRSLQASEGLEAEPVHAGVEMERARVRPIATRGEGGPALKLLFAADHRRQSMLGIVRRIGPTFEAVEHVDLSLRRENPPRRDPLVQVGDEEDARPRAPQRRRRFGEADPVSIGLDDGGATPRRRAPREFAPIVGKRAEVDPKTYRSAHGSHHASHPRTFSMTAVVGASNPGCASISRRANP